MEKSQANAKPNNSVDERDGKGATRPNLRESVQRPVEEKKQELVQSPVEEKKDEPKVVTNRQFLESKLQNCKNFVSSISCLENSALLKSFQSLTSREVLAWVITITNEKKPLDAALHELFQFYKMDASQLKKEEFTKLLAYFHCFQTLVTTTF
jgi:hypothetical protein